jgi:GAF domain-containing protein
LRLSKTSFDELQRSNRLAGTGVLFAMIRTSSERIRRLSAHLVVYDEVGKAMGEAPDLQTLLDIILQQLAAAVSADWGIIVLRSQFTDRLELRSRLRITLTDAQVEAIAKATGFLGTLLANPQDQLVANFEADARFGSCQRLGFETASLLLTPISVEGQLLGLVALGGKTPCQFDLDTLNLARGIARQTGQAILNARHREEDQSRSRHARQFVRF